MRIVNRLASILLALALTAFGVLVAIEAATLATGRRPVVVPWDRWYDAVSRTRVTDTAVLVGGVVAVGVGLLILVAELRRWRPVRLPTTSDGWHVRRRDMERRIAARLDRISGVAGARARLSRRWRLRVAVVADPDAVPTVEEAADAELDRVCAPAERRITVTARRPRRVV